MLLLAINKNNCFINMTNDEFTFIIYSLLTRSLRSRCGVSPFNGSDMPRTADNTPLVIPQDYL